ncbi:hypothetical protein XELAEV_18003785mg [Xenopus laevis]|nr:hypothetical protein XELAEV_18003785mg [Xenopus laevis]
MSRNDSSSTESSDEESYNAVLEELNQRPEIVNATECFPKNPLNIKKRKTSTKEVIGEKSSEDQSSSSDASETFREDKRRIGNNDWCLCGMCLPMTTAIESLCCYEVDIIHSKIPVEGFCITDNEEYKFECVNRDRADWNYRMSKFRITKFPPLAKYMRALRKIAYRAFIVWIYTFLGLHNHRVIPACVVRDIREKFPDPKGKYTGFLKARDYFAEDMALESD